MIKYVSRSACEKNRRTLPKKILIWFLCLLAYALSTYIPIHIPGDPINAAGIKGLIALLSLLVSIFTARYLCRRVDRKQSEEEDDQPTPSQPETSPDSKQTAMPNDPPQPLDKPETIEPSISDISQPTSQEQAPAQRHRGRLILRPIDPSPLDNADSKDAPEPSPASAPCKSRKPAVIFVLCVASLFGLWLWYAISYRQSTARASSTSTSPYTTTDTNALFVGSRSSSLVHRASCRYVAQISISNRVYYASLYLAHQDSRTDCLTCLGGSTGDFAEWSDRRQSDSILEQVINATRPPRITSLGRWDREERETTSAQVLPRPDNGYIFEEPGEEALAPLSIVTQGENDYYIVLDPLHNAVWNKMSFYVRGGQSAKVFVPLGDYEIYYATGSAWYGLDDLFGSDTLYRKCDDTFEFYEDGDSYQGWTLTLYPQPNGNLDTETISANEFPS